MPKLSRALPLALGLAFASNLLAQRTIHVPADPDAPTIQAGINVANAGDTVLVAPGTYYENIDFGGKAITVTSSGGASVTTLDGSSRDAAVKFSHGEPRAAVFSGFTVLHGGSFGTTGNQFFLPGAINISTNSSPTVLNNVITAGLCWGIVTTRSAPLIQGNNISATHDLGNCSFGGGAAIYVSGNLNGALPDGINDVAPRIIGNTIENNVESGLEDAGGNGGAAVAVWGGSPLMMNNIMRNNNSPGGSGGAINIVSGIDIVIAQNLIYGNKAGCGGGAIATQGSGIGPDFDVVVANNTIVDNITGPGGGYSECTNIAQIYPSPLSYGTAGPTQVFVNNIISGSTSYAAVNCSDFEGLNEATQPIFDHNLLLNSGGRFFGNYCVDVSGKYGNIVGDPHFADSAYHLKATSPVFDAGNTSVLQIIRKLTSVSLDKDLDGTNARVQDATGKGYPVIDMGAYEFGGALDASPTTVVVSASSYYGDAGSNYTLTATLASSLGVPTGSVDFYVDGSLAGTSNIANGVATLSNFLFKPGIHNIYANYAGQGSFTPGKSVIIIVEINKYTTTLKLTNTPNPSFVNQAVTFTLHAASADPNYIPTPVQLIDGSTLLYTFMPDSSGNATFTTSSLALGYHYITANYAGDSLHAPGSYPVSQQVITAYQTSMRLNSAPNPSVTNQTVTMTAQVSSANGVPQGTVSFADGSTVLGTQSLNGLGTATLPTFWAKRGTHNLTATYTPSNTFQSNSATTVQTVNGADTTSKLTVTPPTSTAGDNVQLTANISAATSGTITGSVTFYADGNLLGSAVTVSGNAATFNTTSLPAGTHNITCAYSGDDTYNPSNCAPVSATVNTATTALTISSSSNPALALNSVTYTATLTSGGKPYAGTAVFSVDGTVAHSAATDNNGSATLTTSLPVGQHTVSVQFAGNAGASGSKASLTENINANPTVTTLTATPNRVYQGAPVAIAATVLSASGTAQAYGTVGFFEGTTQLASAAIAQSQASSTAIFSTSALAPGMHAVTAVYTPTDGNFLASSAAAITITVIPQGFSLTTDTPKLTIQTEHHASMTLKLTSFGGFIGSVQLACGSPLPPVATCELAPATRLAANTTAPVTLTIDTDAVLNFKSEASHPDPHAHNRELLTLAALFPLAIFAFRRRRGAMRWLATLLLLAGGAAGISGCSSKYPDHTPAGTYDLTVNAIGAPDGIPAAATTQTLHITLQVTQ